MSGQNHSSLYILLLIPTLAVMPISHDVIAQSNPLGLFENHSDIGMVKHPGQVEFDATNGSYIITGSGENMWFEQDAFHFVWKQMSGDFSLEAAIQWKSSGGNAHRKACLLIRQELTNNSAYADAVIHGNGLTSLQYREKAGEPTREVQSTINAPKRIRITRSGNTVFMSVAGQGEEFKPAGGSFTLSLNNPVYVGLGVCSHDIDRLETAIFSNVIPKQVKMNITTNSIVESTLETISISSKDRRAVYCIQDLIEAPNWSPDGKYFLYNRHGKIYTLPVEGGKPTLLDSGFANQCNNDHGISPDGKYLAISDGSQKRTSLINTLPIQGGIPRLITPNGPSYWHGWSPDGKTLVYCAQRNGEYDIYAIPSEGGAERRLTNVPGLDDGPEYTPDARSIYFNSDRTATMKIWRMKPDGSEQEQVTFDEYNDWFPHPSPDGKWIVFLSYNKEVTGHPPNQHVLLRLMPIQGGGIQVLAKLFGGQGTINVPSWSPDSKQLAFGSYRLIDPLEE